MVRRLVVYRVILFVFILFANASHAEGHEIVFSSSFDHAKISVFSAPAPSPHMSGFLNFAYRGRVIALAKGLVKVPADVFVSVEITAKDGYVDFLASLPENGIDRLELRGAKISTSLLQQFERLKSVRQLVLVDCVMDEIDAASLHGAAKLQSVSIESRQNNEESRLIPWLAKCTSLQSIPDGGPLSIDQLKMLQQHHGPLFLKVKLDNHAIDTLDALAAIPSLAGVQVEISKKVLLQDLTRLARLKNVEVITLNDGLFNAGLVGVLGQLPKLRILRVQGETAVDDDFLDALAKLTRIEAVTFTRPLPVDVERKFADTMLRMQNVRELPRLVNATAEQLAAIASRKDYQSLEIVGLDRSSDEMRLAEAIRNNPL